MHAQRTSKTLKPMTSTPEGSQRRLTLSTNDRKIAGVCGGLAEYFNTDATLVRLIFVVLIMLGGIGVIIYLIAWIIMPTAALMSADDMLGRLQKLGELKKDGLLTEAEFQTQKAKILAG
jgi:phage shock protein C